MMAGGENINSGSNKFNPASINKALQNTGKSKFYKAALSPNDEEFKFSDQVDEKIN